MRWARKLGFTLASWLLFMKLGRLTKVTRDLDSGQSRKYELRVKGDGEVAVQEMVEASEETK